MIARLGVLVLFAAPSLPPFSSPSSPGSDLEPLAFATTLIDPVRAGGEPVIQVTPKGTLLVASHPGWTHTATRPRPTS